MLEPYHQEVEHWARQQRDQFMDRLDDHNHPTARLIYHNIEQLENAAQEGRNLRSLHDRMEVIERQVLQAQHANEHFMNPAHSVDMFHTFQNKRFDLRRHPHF